MMIIMMEVLVNKTVFCMQSVNQKSHAVNLVCRDDGTGRAFNYTASKSGIAWIAVNIAEGGAPNEVVVDLSTINRTLFPHIFAIRYDWTGDCCSENPPTSKPCPLASCPIMGSNSMLPANPFVAHITSEGKCKCIAPQICDA
jgi:hypothetical protein